MDDQKTTAAMLISAAQDADRRNSPLEALHAWQAVKTIFPDVPAAFIREAANLKLLGRLPEAEMVLGHAVERFPNNERVAIDYAWVVFERGDLQKSMSVWHTVRNRFPNNLSAYHGGGLASCRARDFDQADTIYCAAFDRFPDNLELLKGFAWSAQNRGDDTAAIKRWRDVTVRFPEVAEGYARVGALLRDANEFDEADLVLKDAIDRFPHNKEIMISYAWVADSRCDWPEALKRWEAVVINFRNLPDGVCGATRALLELSRFDDAKTLIVPALRMFPDSLQVALISGWLATRRRAAGEAEKIWRDIRERFPDETAGYIGWATVLRDEGRLDEAMTILTDASERFPTVPHIAMDLAQLFNDKRNWKAAVKRWRDAFQRFPEMPRAYLGLGETLIAAGDVEEANTIFNAGVERFPYDFHLVAAYARAAASMQDWSEAVKRGTKLIERFSGNPIAYVVLGRMLRESGQFVRSDQHLQQALVRFPNNFELELQLALTMSAKRDWPLALSLWESLKQRYPSNGAVRSCLADVLWQARQDQLAIDGDQEQALLSFEIPNSLLEDHDDEGNHRKTITALLMRFESIGDSCEFGMVQRRFGAEPVSLLRWTSTAPDDLVTALETRFAGVGDQENTVIEAVNGEYTTRDKRYYMFAHTFVLATSEVIEEFSSQQLRRMQYLRRKLLSDFEAAKKIFVYKSEDGITDTQLTAVYRALRNYSKNIILLCVKLQEQGHSSKTLERIEEGLFVGYIDKFSTVDISVDVWLSLCERTVAELSRSSKKALA